MTAPYQGDNNFVAIYSAAPEKQEDMRAFTVEQLRRHANGINVREIGWMLDEETQTGKQFIPGISSPTDQVYRNVFRIVVNFGALPNAGTKSVPHGITFDANFTLIQLWASATDPVNFLAIPIPYVSAASPIQLNMDATNVNITTTVNYMAYTRCYVIIEYLLEK